MSPHPSNVRLLLSLTPALMAAGMWSISAALGAFRIGHFVIAGWLVEIGSSSWRAVEIAIVNGPQHFRGVEYSVLPKSHPSLLGVYIGPVAGSAPSTTLIILPYYLLLLVFLWPALGLIRRLYTARREMRGFEVQPPAPGSG